MTLSDPISVVNKLVRVLNQLEIKYLIGGSLASSLYGVPRATQDVDVVAAITEKQIQKLHELLSVEFYFDIDLAKEAILHASSFNVIDRELLYKIDIFIQKQDDLSFVEMDRRRLYTIDDPGKSIYLCSPEDIIAHKLYWYKLGNEISERQWNDALNVLKVQKRNLDMEYLTQVCTARGIKNFLDRLLLLKM
jgi:hypothetical protein